MVMVLRSLMALLWVITGARAIGGVGGDPDPVTGAVLLTAAYFYLSAEGYSRATVRR